MHLITAIKKLKDLMTAHKVTTKKFGFIISTFLSVLIISYYYYKASNLLKTPTEVAYSSWLGNIAKQLTQSPEKCKVILIVHLPTSEPKTIKLESSNSLSDEKHTNIKIVRLLQLADTSRLFSEKIETPNPDSSYVEIHSDSQIYVATIHDKKLAKNSALQTFLKLFEIYSKDIGVKYENT